MAVVTVDQHVLHLNKVLSFIDDDGMNIIVIIKYDVHDTACST